MVVIVGDVREDEALRVVRDAYGAIRTRRDPAPRTRSPSRRSSSRATSSSRSRRANDKVLIGYHGPGAGRRRSRARSRCSSEILFGGRASRAYRSLVTERRARSEVRGWVSTFCDPGLFELYAAAREGAHVRRARRRARQGARSRATRGAERGRAGARQGAPRALDVAVARDDERQGRADRLLRDGARRSVGRVPAARRVPARDRERRAQARRGGTSKARAPSSASSPTRAAAKKAPTKAKAKRRPNDPSGRRSISTAARR